MSDPDKSPFQMTASEIAREIVLFFQNIHPLAAAVLLLPISALILFGIMQVQLAVCHLVAIQSRLQLSLIRPNNAISIDKLLLVPSTVGRSLTRAV